MKVTFNVVQNNLLSTVEPFSFHKVLINGHSSAKMSPLRFLAGCRIRRLNLDYNLSRFIFCCRISVFDDLYFADLVSIGFSFVLA